MKKTLDNLLKDKLGIKLSDNFKFSFLIIILSVLGIVEICMYWNSHVYYRAKKHEDVVKKIRILNRAIPFFPSNDSVYYEMGKAYLDRAVDNIQEEGFDSASLQRSIQSFEKSIKLNPASQFSHFYLAQSLLNQSLFTSSPSSDLSIYEEYKKAAILAGNNSQIFFEVGKIFLSRWSQISDEDREFTIEILKKVLSMKDNSRLRTVLNLWDMNVRSYEVMDALLPEDAEIYRIYANFLGERSLSLDERHKILALAEYMDFERASYEHSLGENNLFYAQVDRALEHFQSCLNILERIKLYQSITSQNLIDRSEFNRVRKSACLNSAKSILGKGEGLTEAQESLMKYLSLEDKVAPLNDLEAYLIYQGSIEEELGTDFEDLDRLSFQLLLYFKQNRYRDIVRIGDLLKQSFLVVPEEQREKYVEVMQIIGDAYQRVNQLYDSSEFYTKALEADPDNLQTLLRARENYERLSEDVKVADISSLIEELLSPHEIDVSAEPPIRKRQEYSRSLVLEGQDIILQLHFQKDWDDRPPLVFVEFNGQVVWEDYLNYEIVSLPMNSRIGENVLRVRAIDQPVTLIRLEYEHRTL